MEIVLAIPHMFSRISPRLQFNKKFISEVLENIDYEQHDITSPSCFVWEMLVFNNLHAELNRYNQLHGKDCVKTYHDINSLEFICSVTKLMKSTIDEVSFRKFIRDYVNKLASIKVNRDILNHICQKYNIGWLYIGEVIE